MICKKCGHELNEGALFCEACGTRVGEEFVEEVKTPTVNKPSVDYAAMAKEGLGKMLETAYGFVCNPYEASLKALQRNDKDWWMLIVASVVIMSIAFSLTVQGMFTVNGQSSLEYIDVTIFTLFLSHFLILTIITALTLGIYYLVLNVLLKQGLSMNQLLHFISVTSLPLTVTVVLAWLLGYLSGWLFILTILIGALAYFGLVHELVRTVLERNTQAFLHYILTSSLLTVSTLVTFYFVYRVMLEEILSSLMYFM